MSETNRPHSENIILEMLEKEGLPWPADMLARNAAERINAVEEKFGPHFENASIRNIPEIALQGTLALWGMLAAIPQVAFQSLDYAIRKHLQRPEV